MSGRRRVTSAVLFLLCVVRVVTVVSSLSPTQHLIVFELSKFFQAHHCVLIAGNTTRLPLHVKDFSGRFISTAVVKVSQLKDFRVSQQTLIVSADGWSGVHTVVVQLRRHHLSMVRVVVFDSGSSPSPDFPVHIYRVHDNTSTISLMYRNQSSVVAMVRHEGESHPRLIHIIPRPRINFHGSEIRNAVVANQECPDDLGNLDIFERVRCVHNDLLLLIGERMNFSTLPVWFRGPYAYSYPNGSYAGLFEMLLERTVDVCTNSLVVTTNRLDSFDFLWPTFTLKTMMYLRQGSTEILWLSYLQPFDALVWCTLVGWLTAATLVTTLLEFLQPTSKPTSVFLAPFFGVWQMLCGQGITQIPVPLSSRITCSMSLLIVVVLVPAYSAYLMSFLTVQQVDLPFLSLDGFFTNGRFKMTVQSDSFIAYYFQFDFVQSRNLTNHDFMVPVKEFPPTDKEGTKGICRGGLAHVGMRANVLALKEFACGIVEIPQPIFLQYLGLGLPKFSPLKEYFTRELAYFMEVGVLSRLKTETNIRQLEQEMTITAVDLQDVLPGLALVAISFLLSTLVLGAEVLTMKKLMAIRTKHKHTHSRHTCSRSSLKIRCWK